MKKNGAKVSEKLGEIDIKRSASVEIGATEIDSDWSLKKCRINIGCKHVEVEWTWDNRELIT